MRSKVRFMGLGFVVGLAGCGAAAVLTPDGGGARTNVNGGNGGGGATGSGGAGGAAGVLAGDGGSLQMITFAVVVPAGHPYCDQATACAPPEHFQVLTAAGQQVPFGTVTCQTLCSVECVPLECPIFCDPSHGVDFVGQQRLWDGAFYTKMTCGMNIPCFDKSYVGPGRYVARMCGTPGVAEPPDAGYDSNCVASGPTVCVDVPFDYPGPSLVTAELP
jgi:hypothetical protein